jgi:hypothetical protein
MTVKRRVFLADMKRKFQDYKGSSTTDDFIAVGISLTVFLYLSAMKLAMALGKGHLNP